MTPIVTAINQAQANQIDTFRSKGFTWAQVGEAMGINHNTARRYHRVLERYGIEAFAIKTKGEIKRNVGQFRRALK